jgi:hypothetical protein
MGLTRRHFAVSLVPQDGHYKCPGGGAIHPLKINGRGTGEWHGWFQCATCDKTVFLLQQKYGLVNVWEIEPHEVVTMERERMGVQQILEFLNRGAKRLDRV